MITAQLRGAVAGAALLAMVPVLSIAILSSTGALDEPLTGLGDPGALTRWGLPVVQGIRDLSAALTVGLLVIASTVLAPDPDRPRGRLGSAQRRAVRLGAKTATVWALAGLVLLTLTYAQVAGSSPLSRGAVDQVWFFVENFDLGRSLAISLVMTVVVALGAWSATRVTTVGLMALLGLGALLPLALTGHAAGSRNHLWAVDAQAAHLIGVSVWFGGLASVALIRTSCGPGFPLVVGRYSRLAGWAFALTAWSGLLAVSARLTNWSQLASVYGLLLSVKVVALVGLGIAGWYQRRAILPVLTANPGSRRLFGRFVAVELVVMAVATGTAVALSRTSPPSASAAEPVSLGESLLGSPVPPPLDAVAWFTQWRIDPLWAVVVVLAIGWYFHSVLRLRHRGDHWPWGRIVSWTAGWLMFLLATNASPGVYGSVLFSMHMIQHMTIAMAVPVLLVLGAPLSLALRSLPKRSDGSSGPREWLLLGAHSRTARLLGHPAVAPPLLIGSLVVYYNSQLFELSLRTHSGHVLMVAHFLISGYLFVNLICGIDPGPSRPSYPFRLIILMITFGFHALFVVSMMGSSQVLGQDWFTALGWESGRTLREDQSLGWSLGWALGDYPLAILAVAMIAAWIAADAKEARRYDRQAARDGDAQLSAYNDYLRRLGTPDRSRIERTGE